MGGGGGNRTAETRRKKKKKGRPSLLELQKRSLRIQKQQEEEEAAKKKRKRASPDPNPYLRFPNAGSGRRSTRRNPDPVAAAADDDDSDDEDEAVPGDSRREKRLNFASQASSSDSDGGSGGVRKRRLDSVGNQTQKPSSARKATDDGSREPGGPTATPLPDKKLLLFILDRLQKKDTYGVYSEPVDPEELPDYHDIIKHPMDFATVRKKLDRRAYQNLEQFEHDVFLISKNAMQYNSPDTIYYRQARAILELAKRDFENLRHESDNSEPEPTPPPESQPEQKPRRGRPPGKNSKQKVGKPQTEQAKLDSSSGVATSAVIDKRPSYPSLDFLRKGLERHNTADATGASFGFRIIDNNWSVERLLQRNGEFSGYGMMAASMKSGGNLTAFEDSSRRSTCNQQNSFADSGRRGLVPIGIRMPNPYSNSLARFAAKLGPVGWEVAARRIKRVLPSGTKFGPGWVGENDLAEPLQSSSATPVSSASTKSQVASMTAVTEVVQVPNSSTIEESHSMAFPASESSEDHNAVRLVQPNSVQSGAEKAVQMKDAYHLSEKNGHVDAPAGHVTTPSQLRKIPGLLSPQPEGTAFECAGQQGVDSASEANIASASGDAASELVCQDRRGLENNLRHPNVNAALQQQPSNGVTADPQHPDLVLQL